MRRCLFLSFAPIPSEKKMYVAYSLFNDEIMNQISKIKIDFIVIARNESVPLFNRGFCLIRRKKRQRRI